MDNSIKNNGNISPSSSRLAAVGPEVAPTASNVQQVNSASTQITQAMCDAKTILSAVQSTEDKALMEIILNQNTNPQDLISTAEAIKDQKTQQRAWLIIADNPLLPIKTRIDGALKLPSSTRNAILEKFLPDPTIAFSEKSYIIASLEDAPAMQQKAYYIIATNEQKFPSYCISAAERITDPEIQQEAFILLAGLPPIQGCIDDQAEAVRQIRDPNQKRLSCLHIINNTPCGKSTTLDLIKVINLLEDSIEKENCAIQIFNSISFWDDRPYSLHTQNRLYVFEQLCRCMTPSKREKILALMLKGNQVSQQFRRIIVQKYIQPEDQARLLDGIENGFKRAKSSRNV